MSPGPWMSADGCVSVWLCVLQCPLAAWCPSSEREPCVTPATTEHPTALWALIIDAAGHAANICLKKNIVVVSLHVFCLFSCHDWLVWPLTGWMCFSAIPCYPLKEERADFLLPWLKLLHLAVMLAAAQILKLDIWVTRPQMFLQWNRAPPTKSLWCK